MQARSESHVSPLARKLFQIILNKQTNLCASLDVPSADQLLELADQIGPYICMVKTHADAVDGFSLNTAQKLKELSVKHNFLIFEDRKFADIGNTVSMQYAQGPFKIAQWADITNAHGVFGPGIISALKQEAQKINEERGMLMLAELSARGNLAHGEYTRECIKLAGSDPQFCFGFIAQQSFESKHDWVIMTPGVGLDDKGDNLGQQYRTVDEVTKCGTDVIIVGRGLFKNRNAVEQAQRYKEEGWKALKKYGRLD